MGDGSCVGLAVWLLAWAWCAVAWAGTPMEVPPGEEEAWVEPMALAGLEPGVPGAGSWVVVESTPRGWQLRVRDDGGTQHSVDIAPVHSQAEREDVVWLAVSLLQPLTDPRPVAAECIDVVDEADVVAFSGVVADSGVDVASVDELLVVTRPESVKPEYAIRPVVPDRPPESELVSVVEILPGVPLATAVEEAPPEVTEPVEVEVVVPGRRGRFWAEVAVGGVVRSAASPGVNLGVGVGVADIGGWDLGLRVDGTGPTRLDLGAERTLACVDATLGVWRPVRLGVVLRPGARVGLSYLRFAQEGEPAGWWLVPVAALDLGVVLRLSAVLVVEPRLGIDADLGSAPLSVGGLVRSGLSPVTAQLGLTLRVGGPSRGAGL